MSNFPHLLVWKRTTRSPAQFETGYSVTIHFFKLRLLSYTRLINNTDRLQQNDWIKLYFTLVKLIYFRDICGMYTIRKVSKLLLTVIVFCYDRQNEGRNLLLVIEETTTLKMTLILPIDLIFASCKFTAIVFNYFYTN